MNRVRKVVAATLVCGGLLACGSDAGQLVRPTLFGPGLAARATAVTVAAASPSFGYEGQIQKHVTIIGSGFRSGATVGWERNGIVDPKVAVVSTIVVSSTQIDVSIDIAADATLALYDISVTNSDRGKGVGTELFEVTTAIALSSLSGNTQATDASERSTGAQIVGWSFKSNVQHAVVWSDRAIQDLGMGSANAIDEAGETIGGQSGTRAVIWTLSGPTWVAANLPIGATTVRSVATSIASDANGLANLIGGSEDSSTNKKAIVKIPVLWRRTSSGWGRVPLNATGAMQVQGVNSRGQAVGGAVFWDSLGVPTILPGNPQPATSVDATGTLITGVIAQAGGSTVAAYWKAQLIGTTRLWSGPFELPGACGRAVAIDDLGRILGHRCVVNGSARLTSVVWSPPYTQAVPLAGLGNSSDGGAAWGMSRKGTRIVGGVSGTGLLWENVLGVP